MGEGGEVGPADLGERATEMVGREAQESGRLGHREASLEDPDQSGPVHNLDTQKRVC